MGKKYVNIGKSHYISGGCLNGITQISSMKEWRNPIPSHSQKVFLVDIL